MWSAELFRRSNKRTEVTQACWFYALYASAAKRKMSVEQRLCLFQEPWFPGNVRTLPLGTNMRKQLH